MEHYPLQMSLFVVACLFTIFIDEIAVRKREEKKRKIQNRHIPQLPDPDSSETKDLNRENARKNENAETPAYRRI